jgi:6-pyruvoyltetrahydropterin/6-carboxytetrahydropterin synthase
MSWVIDKQFSFCYGHRVWVQELLHDYCAKGDTKTKCRHLHGHEGLVHVFLEGDELNKQGMVTDFKHLGWLKDFLDDVIDHKFIIDVNDPRFEKTINGKIDRSQNNLFVTDSGSEIPMVPLVVPGTNMLVAYKLDTYTLHGPDQEFYDGFVIVDFVPTSENLSKWLFDIVDAKMSLIDVQVTRIDWFETPNLDLHT